MEFKLKHTLLRPWKTEDAEALAKHANNKNIADNLRDGFPYPYTLHDARSWLEFAINNNNFLLAIDHEGEAIGGVGIIYKTDIYRKSAEVGYWLSQEFWGQGIMTEAIITIVNHTFDNTDIVRIYAGIFENNPASATVLKKVGFKLEAVHEQAIFKNGKFMNEMFYVKLKN